MYCEKCGHKLLKNAAYCDNCGDPVAEDKTEKSVAVGRATQTEGPREPGGFWMRAGAFLIDYIAVLVLGVLIGQLGFAEIFGIFNAEILGLFLIVGYHTVALASYSTTFGKRMFGLKVADAKDRRDLSFGKSAGRSLAYILSAMFLGLGFWMVAFNKEKRAWHDKLAGTVVLRDRSQKLILGIILASLSLVFLVLMLWSASNDAGTWEYYGSSVRQI